MAVKGSNLLVIFLCNRSGLRARHSWVVFPGRRLQAERFEMRGVRKAVLCLTLVSGKMADCLPVRCRFPVVLLEGSSGLAGIK